MQTSQPTFRFTAQTVQWDPRCWMVSVTLDPTCLAVTPGNTWQLGVLIFGWRFIMIHHVIHLQYAGWLSVGLPEGLTDLCVKKEAHYDMARTRSSWVQIRQNAWSQCTVDLYCLSLLTRPRLRPRLRLGRHWGGSMYRLNHQTAPVPKKCFQVTPFAPVKCPNHYTTGEATWKKIRTSMLAYNWTSQV